MKKALSLSAALLCSTLLFSCHSHVHQETAAKDEIKTTEADLANAEAKAAEAAKAVEEDAKRAAALVAEVVASPAQPLLGNYNKKLAIALEGQLVDKDGNEISAKRISAKKHLLVYYSAHWCPPCRGFTPKLAKWYDDNHEDYEVLFVSSDRNQAKMLEYMKGSGMNWIGVKLKSAGHKALSPYRQGAGIPNLVLITNDERVVGSYNSDKKYTGPATAYNELQKILKTK